MLGVRVKRLLTLGWALAAAAGALAGLFVAPSVFLYPQNMDSVLIFGFTAAIIGGLASYPGAALAALGGGCQVPIGIHCRPSFSENASSGSWVEIFGVVASPDSGQIVRVHLHAPLQNTDPVSLGHEAAEMLLAQGAGPLLAAAGNFPGGAA